MDFEFKFLNTCLILLMLNCLIKGNDSSLNCCFQVLKNQSVSNELSEPPGVSCTSMWSAGGVVVVDERGDVDPNTVVYYEPQKLILKGNMNDKVKQVMYHQDCPLTGLAYIAECLDPCAAVEVPGNTQGSYNVSTEAPGVDKKIIIFIIISVAVIGSGSIIIASCQRKRSATHQMLISGMSAVPWHKTSIAEVDPQV